jgi:hypothetical protein
MNIQYDACDSWINQKQMNIAINQEKKRQLRERFRGEFEAKGIPEEDWDKIIDEHMNLNHLWQK